MSIVGLKEVGIIQQSTSDLVFSHLASQSTLGFVLDDPSNVSILSEKILNHFEGKAVVSFSKNKRPACTFTASINLPCRKKLAAEARLVCQ